MTGLAGGIGLGLVWGWLLAGHEAPARRRLVQYAALSAATALAIAETAALADERVAAGFVAATCGALAIRLIWHSRLRRHAAQVSAGP